VSGRNSLEVSARGHLRRAKLLLCSKELANLRYAALELRCCVETRQADYLNAMSWLKSPKVKRWETSKVSRALSRYWDDPKIAQIVYNLPSGSWSTYFTPVTKPLVEACAKETGLLLHAIENDLADEISWWRDRREGLLALYRQAWVACRGEHIAMPIWDATSRSMHPVLLYVEDDHEHSLKSLVSHFETGREVSFSIDYLDDPPSDWKCDL
jgi:hypothetical protein